MKAAKSKYDFTPEQIEVMRPDADVMTFSQFGRKYGIPQKSVGGVLRRYGLGKGKPPKAPQQKYSAEVKAQAIAMIDTMMVKEIAAKLGVPVGTLNDWIYRHRQGEAERLEREIGSGGAGHWPGACFRLIIDGGRYWLWPRSMADAPGIFATGYSIADGIVHLPYESGELIARARNEKIHPAAIDRVRRYILARLKASRVQASVLFEALTIESLSHYGQQPDGQRQREIGLAARLALQTLGAYGHARNHKDRAAVAAIFAGNISESIKKDRAA